MSGVLSTAQLADLVTGHMAAHGLPEPASLHLVAHTVDQQEASVQLRTSGLADTAAGLLAWASAQAAVRLEAWRPPSGAAVHLDVHTTLTSEHGTVDLVGLRRSPLHPAVFGELEPGQHSSMSLGQLTAWATSSGTEVAA